jgi:hypothetical protein
MTPAPSCRLPPVLTADANEAGTGLNRVGGGDRPGQRWLRRRISPPLEPGEFVPFMQLQKAMSVDSVRVVPSPTPPPVLHIELSFLRGQPANTSFPSPSFARASGLRATRSSSRRSVVARALMRIKAGARIGEGPGTGHSCAPDTTAGLGKVLRRGSQTKEPPALL